MPDTTHPLFESLKTVICDAIDLASLAHAPSPSDPADSQDGETIGYFALWGVRTIQTSITTKTLSALVRHLAKHNRNPVSIFVIRDTSSTTTPYTITPLTSTAYDHILTTEP